ncbi:MAG: hypothetical protein JXR84_04760 [Anaerolineae bacterium]|nr:hypothetical protein [Anaerolineae bacterium]
MIRLTHLSKHFKVAQPGEGLVGKVQRWFAPRHKIIKAVDDIGFEVGQGDEGGISGNWHFWRTCRL